MFLHSSDEKFNWCPVAPTTRQRRREGRSAKKSNGLLFSRKRLALVSVRFKVTHSRMSRRTGDFEPCHKGARFWLKSNTANAVWPTAGSRPSASSSWRCVSSDCRFKSADFSVNTPSSIAPLKYPFSNRCCMFASSLRRLASAFLRAARVCETSLNAASRASRNQAAIFGVGRRIVSSSRTMAASTSASFHRTRGWSASWWSSPQR